MKLNPSGICLSLCVYMASSIWGRSQTLGSIQQSQKKPRNRGFFFFNSSLDYRLQKALGLPDDTPIIDYPRHTLHLHFGYAD